MTSRRRASSSHPRVSSLDTNFEWPRCLSSDGYGGLFWFRGGDHKETTTVFRFHRIAKGLLHHDNSDGRTQSPVGLVGGLFPVRGTSSVITGSFIYRLLHTSLARHLYKAFVYHLVGYIYLSLFPPPSSLILEMPCTILCIVLLHLTLLLSGTESILTIISPSSISPSRREFYCVRQSLRR